MKKIIILTSLLATAALSTQHLQAKSSTEENVGFASGAAIGGALGGPVGLMLGSAIGALIGNKVEQANELPDIEKQLAQANQTKTQLAQEIHMLQEDFSIAIERQTTQQWLSAGVSLNLMFTTNSTELSDSDRDNIAHLAEILKNNPELNLRLDGYADPRGSKQANLTLSQQRVSSVIQAFESLGIQSDRLLGVAHGEMDGLESIESPDILAMARKVKVKFHRATGGQFAQN